MDVKVTLGLDTSKAEAQYQQFFSKLGSQKLGANPLGPLDKAFADTAAKAKQLGFEWDQALGKFKSSSGNTAGIESISDLIKATELRAKALGTTFPELAAKIKGLDGSAGTTSKTFGSLNQTLDKTKTSVSGLNVGTLAQQLNQANTATNQAGVSFGRLGTSIAGVKTQFGGLSQGTQVLNQIGPASDAAGNSLDSTGQSAEDLVNELLGIKGSSDGITTVGTNASNADGKLDGLGSSVKTVKSELLGIGVSNGKLVELGTNAQGATGKVTGLGQASDKVTTSLKSIGSSGNGLKTAGVDADALGKKVLGASNETGKLTTGLKNVGGSSSSIKPISTILGETQRGATGAVTAVGPLAEKIRAVGATAPTLKAIPQSFTPIPQAVSQATSAMQKLPPIFREGELSASRFGKAIDEGIYQVLVGIPQGVGMSIGNALIAPIKELASVIPNAVSEFRKLDESIRLTLTVSGESASSFGRLRDIILGVSSATKATAAEVAQVAQDLSKAGFSLDSITEALGAIVQGAEATGTAYEAMGSIVISALGQFGIETSKTADVVDTLVVAANAAAQDVTDVGEALKYVGPQARSSGQSLQDVALGLEILANNGIKGSQAGTAFRTILTNLQIAASGAGEEFLELSKGSEKLAATLKLIGANVTDANGELKKGGDLIKGLKESLNTLSTGERAIITKALVGAEGGPALTAFLNTTNGQIDDLADGLANRTGVAAKQAGDQVKGLEGAFKLLESSISVTLIAIGDFVAKALTPIVSGINNVVVAFNSLPGPVKEFIFALTGIAATVGVTNAAIQLLGKTTELTFSTAVIGKITAFFKAFTVDNVQNTIAGLVNGFKSLGEALRAGIATNALKAAEGIKAFTAAIKSGEVMKNFTGILQAVWNGLKGIPAAAAGSAVQLELFGTSGVAAGAGGAAAAAGATATGAASTAATPAVMSLGAAIGGLVTALAPFLLIAGAVILIVAYLKDRYDKAKEATAGLQASQDKLEASMEKQNSTMREGADALESNLRWLPGMEGGYRSWGKSLSEIMGPLDRLLNVILPGVWPLIKLTAEALGRLNEWDQARVKVDALRGAHEQFSKTLELSNQKIAANVVQMGMLNPASEEYGRLAAENVDLLTQQVAATEERIAAIDTEIAKMKENEEANKGVIKELENEKNALQAKLPIMKENLVAMQEEIKRYEEATGKGAEYAKSLATLAYERGKAYAAIDTKVQQQELKLMADVREGLVTETEARAVNAKAAVDAANKKLGADEEYMKGLKQLYAEGKITQSEYETKVKEVTEKIGTSLKDRAEAEKALKEATVAAVNERLDAYMEEVNAIGQVNEAISNMMSNIGQIGSSGIDAWKGLADAVTNYELTGIQKTKDARLKAIEESGATDLEKTRMKKDAEKDYVETRKSIMAQQIAIERKAQEASYNAKKIELQLWYEQAKIATEIAIQEAKVNILKAQAEGKDQKVIDAYKKQLELRNFQLGLLDKEKALKDQILDIQDDTNTQTLNTKALQEGIVEQNGGIVRSYQSISAGIDQWQSGINAARTEIDALGEGWRVVPDRAEEEYQKTVDIINQKLGDVDYNQIVDSYQRLGVGEELSNALANDMVEGLENGSSEGINLAADNMAERFPDMIPKALIKSSLIQAMMEGGDVGAEQAAKQFENFDEYMPTEQVAMILGNAIGGGAEEGMQILANTPVPPGLFKNVGQYTQNAIGEAGEIGAERMADAILDGSQKAFGYTREELVKAIESGAFDGKGYLEGMYTKASADGKAKLRESLGIGISEGAQDGSEKMAELLLTTFPQELKGVTRDELSAALSEAGTIGGERLLEIYKGLSVEGKQILSSFVSDGLKEGATLGADEFKNAVETKFTAAGGESIGTKLGNAIVKGTGDAINAGGTAFNNAFNQAFAGTQVDENVFGWFDKVYSWGEKVANDMGQGYNNTVGKVFNNGGAIEFFEEMAGKGTTYGEQTGENLGAGVSKKVGEWASTGGTATASFLGWASTTGVDSGLRYSDTFKEQLNNLPAYLVTKTPGFVDWAGTTGQQTGANLWKGITDGANNLGTTLSTQSANFVNWATTTGQQMAVGLWDGQKTKAQESVLNLQNVGSQFVTWAQNTGNQIGTGISNGINTTSKAILDTGTGIKEWGAGLVNSGLQWGQQTGKGIGDGINGAKDYIKNSGGWEEIGLELIGKGTLWGKQTGDNIGANIITGVDNTVKQKGWGNALADFVQKGREVGTQVGTNIGEFMKGPFIEKFKLATGEMVPIADAKAKEVGTKFGGLIPKEAISEDLRIALSDGTAKGGAEADKIIKNLPNAIPREQVAKILGDSFGQGVKGGEAYLKTIKLPPEVGADIKGKTAESLKQGGAEGGKQAGDEVKAKSSALIAAGVSEAFKKGAKAGTSEVVTWSKEAGDKIGENLAVGGKKSSTELVKDYKAAIGEIKTAFKDIGADDIQFDKLKAELDRTFLGPIKEAETALKGLQVAPGIKEALKEAGAGATEIKRSGIGLEMKTAKDATKLMNDAMQRAKSAMSLAVGSARSIASYWERAASAADKVARAKFAGGPVVGGQQYTVNELGREMFMSNTGTLSEIRVPAYGNWVAPSSGTVIPAGMAERLREAKDARQSNVAMASLRTGKLVIENKTDGNSNWQNALIRELRSFSDQSGQVVNNVNITSERPVNDASRMLVEMSRLRAMRRR